MHRIHPQHASSLDAPTHQRRSPVGRGLLISLIAVFSTAAAHCIAASHAPTLGAVVLALAVVAPACIALASTPHTRRQLLGMVVAGQALLHGVFSISAGVGSAEQVYALLTNTSCSALLAHGAALGLTYAVLRRGDELIELLHTILNLNGALLTAPLVVGVLPSRISLTNDVWAPAEVRPSKGPSPLRGPPALAS